MPTDRLSDARVRSLKPGEKPVKHFDGLGLYVLVQPSGAKLWRLAYRIDGRPQTASFGAYPEVTLAEARRRRDALRATLRDGLDPRVKRAPPEPARITLATACSDYWSRRGDVSAGYRSNAVRALEMHVLPLLGQRPIADITRAELLDCLGRMDAAGLHVYVRRVRMWLGLVWEWSVEHGHAAANIPATIRPERAFASRPVQHFAAVSLPELPALMQRLALEADIQSVLACRMLAYTWVRTGELRRMEWTEIDGDVWRIPAARMKRRRGDHLVPLSAQAVALLDRLRARSRGSVYVFPSDHRPDRPMSENAVLYLLHRIGYKGRMTGHGWRAVGSTWANERGHPADVIERQLAHEPDDDVRAVYNRAEYLPQRRAMLQAWASWLDSLTAD